MTPQRLPQLPHLPRTPRESIHGVFFLDKPLGLSSQTAMQQVRRLLQADKVGHGGTLDPLASGFLPLLFGEATKYAQDLLGADKTYSGEICFGITTTTDDREGEVVTSQEVSLDGNRLAQAMQHYVGEIEQIPPIYSALKKDGKPLYAYARAGQTVDIASRRVRIDGFELTGLQGNIAGFRVRCSKGTYIRSLARDLGRSLGVGAHLHSLRRDAIHHDGRDLSLDQALSIEQLNAQESLQERRATLLPVDSLVQSLSRLDLDETLARRFMQGQRIPMQREALTVASSASSPSSALLTSLASQAIDHATDTIDLRIYYNNHLLGRGSWQLGVLSPQRLVGAELNPLN